MHNCLSSQLSKIINGRRTELRELSKHLRKQALAMYHSANAGHIACSLSCIDLMAVTLIKHKAPDDDFILSKGHAAVALYVCLNHTGIISQNQLDSFYKNGTLLPAHPAPQSFDAIPFATGSLGHGLPIANGIAKSNKLSKKPAKVFVLMSDGETNEGTTWEAAHFAVQHQLDNLIVMIDKNKIQGFGKTDQILGDTAALKKWESIGFEVFEIDGHHHEEIEQTLKTCALSINGKPKVIIANTVKGKGVSYMENTVDWHYWPMDKEGYERAINDIDKM